MKVRELIALLQQQNPEDNVRLEVDGVMSSEYPDGRGGIQIHKPSPEGRHTLCQSHPDSVVISSTWYAES
jgi:hypothetical protein